jgi:hypothetical protein
MNTVRYIQKNSVADPGCLARSPDPDFCPSRIPDPKMATKERGEKKCCTFFVATKITKLKIILILNWRRKIFGPFFKELQNFLPKKLSLSSQNLIWIRVPRSGIRKKPIPDPGPGVKKALDPGSGSATLEKKIRTAHLLRQKIPMKKGPF